MKSRWTFRDQARFWRLVDTSDLSGCWLWRGADDGRFGHGKFKVAGVSVRAIRWLCELYAPGCLRRRRGRHRVVRHTCDNPRCVRPDHLVPGTQRQNVRDAIARLKVPLATYAGVDITIFTPEDQLSLTAELDLYAFGRSDRWLYLLQALGLERYGAVAEKGWRGQPWDRSPAAVLTTALAAASGRLSLTRAS